MRCTAEDAGATRPLLRGGFALGTAFA